MTVEVDDFGINDIIIRMTPDFDNEDRWSGYIDMQIITDNKHTIQKNDFINLMQVASLICSSLPVMEINEDFRNTLCDYVESMVEQDKKDEKKELIKESVNNTTGNIIRVNFKRKEKP
jgi:hypothetical protein|tara:strand:- start:74 stop:427 length:354 start_codon:yes stop_codon:yes gene_type:complete